VRLTALFFKTFSLGYYLIFLYFELSCFFRGEDVGLGETCAHGLLIVFLQCAF
jgi:hypothetical protein